MAHVWNLVKEDARDRWVAAALAGDGFVVTCNGDGVELRSPAGVVAVGPGSVMILPSGRPGASQRWTLLAGRETGVRINGLPLALGIRALADKDEILADGHRLFFSTEDLARVVPFPGLAQAAFCPRCKQTIEPGDPAVCCPGCRAWSHQSERYPCWTYGQTCALCQQQSTALDAGYSFNPAAL